MAALKALRPLNAYGWSKALFDIHAVREAARGMGLTGRQVLRYFATLYGIKDITGRETKASTSGGTSDGRFIATICRELVELVGVESLVAVDKRPGRLNLTASGSLGLAAAARKRLGDDRLEIVDVVEEAAVELVDRRVEGARIPNAFERAPGGGAESGGGPGLTPGRPLREGGRA